MQLNISTVIFTIINTLILYWFLRRLLFKPVTNFINNRTNSIEGNIKEAELKLQNAENLKVEYENKILELQNEGRRIVEEHKRKALALSENIIGEAKKESDTVRERARIDIERERERVKDEIKKQIIDLSILASSKAIEESLDEEKHHKLIKDFIDEVVV